MKLNFRNIVFATGILFLLLLLWNFPKIFIYIFISVFFSIIGNPIVRELNKIRIKKVKIPKGISAIIALLVIWLVFAGILKFVIPFIFSFAKDLSKVNVNDFVDNYKPLIENLKSMLVSFNIYDNADNFNTFVTDKLLHFLNFANISNIVKIVLSLIGNIFVAIFSISFISFFFLKDENLFPNTLFLLIPKEYHKNFNRILLSVRKNLIRYFLGIIIEVLLVATLVTVGMLIVGFEFKYAIILGLIAGTLNIIPYIGPLLGALIGIIIALFLNINISVFSDILPLFGFMGIVYLSVQLLDNILFQPLIYSNSINAHPLEIFLVIMFAGSFGGILAMALAIPVYTVIRVVVKEFIVNFYNKTD